MHSLFYIEAFTIKFTIKQDQGLFCWGACTKPKHPGWGRLPYPDKVVEDGTFRHPGVSEWLH